MHIKDLDNKSSNLAKSFFPLKKTCPKNLNLKNSSVSKSKQSKPNWNKELGKIIKTIFLLFLSNSVLIYLNVKFLLLFNYLNS